MKIRSDFVSNSSSSSFIVSNGQGNAQLLCQKFAETFGTSQIEGIFAYDESIRISLFCKNKDVEFIQKFLVENNPKYFIYDEQHLEYNELHDTANNNCNVDPEQRRWDPIFIKFDDLFIIAQSSLVSSKIIELFFSTEYDGDPASSRKIAMLYKFFRALGCHPDASTSDQAFLDDDSNCFEQTMQKVIEVNENKQ